MNNEVVILSGALFVALLALGQLIVQNKSKSNTILFFLFIVCFFWIFHAALYRMGFVSAYPHLNKLHVPFLAATGPLWYGYVKSLYKDSDGHPIRVRYFLPVVACFILSIPFYLETAEFKRSYIETEMINFASVCMYWSTRLAEVSLMYFLFRALLFLKSIIFKDKDYRYQPHSSLYLLVFTLVALFAGVLRIVGSVINDTSMSVSIPSMMALAVLIGMYLISYRYPVILNLVRSARHIKTPSAEADTTILNLKNTLKEQRWHLDPDLKINHVARKIGMPSKHLSEIIGVSEYDNFKSLINSLRIEHAQTLLVESPLITVEDVFGASGFNSKAVFYTQFKKHVGKSPAEYRKENAESTV